MKSIGLLLISILFISSFQASAYQTEITVSQDGNGDYTTIQAAIDACKAFPDKPVTVFVKNGVYYEKVKIPACNTNLSLIGESAEKTIITYDDYFDKIDRGRNSTFYTYTLKVEADDFYMENLTIANTSGSVGQAVALHISGNRCSIKKCKLLGHQDTLYTAGEKSCQYFSECLIEGTTDFIFGAATVLFDQCTIHSLSDSYITAASTFKGRTYGYVFKNCKLTAADGVHEVYLGRPWRPYAKTVFINCELGSHILPAGWKEWSNKEDKNTTFYAEYDNTGDGSNIQERIDWSNQLSDEEAQKYSTENILGNWVK